MSKGYRISDRAQADLEDIFEYIAHADLDAAIRVDLEIHEACNLLTTQPHMGYTRPRIDAKYRFHPVYSYQIIYLPDSDPLEIVRVWHGAQRSPQL